MKEEIHRKFHGMVNGFIIKVVEGNGTEKEPFREVQYVYSEDLFLIGAIDHIKQPQDELYKGNL